MNPSWNAAPFAALPVEVPALDPVLAGVLVALVALVALAVVELFFELEPHAVMPAMATTAHAATPTRLILTILSFSTDCLR
jgi:hypothetical protein